MLTVLQAEPHGPLPLVSAVDVLFVLTGLCVQCSSTQVSLRCCPAARVVCKAQVGKAPVAAAAASFTSLIAAHPALALVRTCAVSASVHCQ